MVKLTVFTITLLFYIYIYLSKALLQMRFYAYVLKNVIDLILPHCRSGDDTLGVVFL